MQGKTARSGNVHASSEEGGYNLSLNDCLFDDGVDFVRSDATIPDRLSRRCTDDDVSRVFVPPNVRVLENQDTLEAP